MYVYNSSIVRICCVLTLCFITLRFSMLLVPSYVTLPDGGYSGPYIHLGPCCADTLKPVSVHQRL